MKPILYVLLIAMLPLTVSAETIKTGNSYVNTSIKTNANDGSVSSSSTTSIHSSGETEVSVINEVNSNSSSTTTTNTYKKIEVNVNGEKKVVESNEPGEIKVEINTKGIVTSQPKETLTISPTKTPTPTPKKDNPSSENKDDLSESITERVRKFIADLFDKIF